MVIQEKIAVWWRGTRPFAFPASVTPVLLGTATAWVHAGVSIHWFRFILTALGVMALHAGSNMFNDYYDYKKGVDREGTFGSSGLLVEKIVSPARLMAGAIAFTLIGALIGIYLWLVVGNLILVLGIVGIAGGFFYTGGPAFKYRALGDLSVFLFFGTFITLGAYYVQTGTFGWLPVLYSIPLGLLIDGILHGNNIRDIQSDAQVNVTTLAGFLGIRGSQYFYLFLVAAAFLSIPVLTLVDHLPWPALAVIFSLPLAIRNVRTVFKSETLPREQFAGIDGMGAQLQMAFGILMTVGVILGKWI